MSILNSALLYLKDRFHNQRTVRHESALINIDPNKQYFIDSEIQITTPIIVPPGGISITGHNFSISKLVADPGITMFEYEDGSHSGDVLITNIEISGGDQIFDLDNNQNFNSIEFNRVNFFNCPSLGSIRNYIQGLSTDVGFFNLTDGLELDGAMSGWANLTSILGEFGVNFTGTLFKAGPSLTMSGRFRTDINVRSIVGGGNISDIAPSNILNDGSFVVEGAIFPAGSTPFPNMPVSSTKAKYEGNTNLEDTHSFSKSVITAEIATNITQNVWTPLAGTYTFSSQVHFDSVGNAHRSLSTLTKTYVVSATFQVRGSQGDLLQARLRFYDSSTDTYTYGQIFEQTVQNYPQSDDRANFYLIDVIRLDAVDQVDIEVRNTTDNSNITGVLGATTVISQV